MFLLLLEGEAHLQSYLQKSLSSEGYCVATFSSRSDLYSVLAQKDFATPNVIVMDHKLSDGESDDLIEVVKKTWPEAPLLMLSDTHDPHHTSESLDRGADDCMTKPVSIEELSARLRVLRRRVHPHLGKAIQVGNTQLNFHLQLAFANGVKIPLCRKEFLLLQMFMEHPSKTHSKFQILDQVWNVHTEVESNVVEVTIRNLRKKLEAAHSSLHIESRRNIGYSIEAALQN